MADGSGSILKKRKPRIAFTGEEYGFGYQAVESLVHDARRDGIPDGGRWAVARLRTEREIEAARNASINTFQFNDTQRQPLRTKEQALVAVKSGTADYAVIPFYSPYAGYDFESLRALSSMFTLLGVEQIEATDQLCLAVHESQVLELAQSSHPGSTLSRFVANQKRWRTSEAYHPKFAAGREGGEPYDDGGASGAMYRSGLTLTQADQKVLMDRLDVIYTTPEGRMRCKAKLDGLASAGVGVESLVEKIEPHRMFARMARQATNPERTVRSEYDPMNNEVRYASFMNGGNHRGALFAMVLPFEVADRSSEFIIVDPDMEDAEPSKTRFMVVENNPDHTLYDDAYRTTDAKTRYWFRRLNAVATHCSKDEGVRVLLRFRRDGAAASIGDVENFLRNFGVRHAVVRMDEDSEKGAPAPIVLDMEFSARDFDYNPARRLRGSVANGAIKKAFQRWKNRGVTVLAAMPYAEPQLPRHSKRRWWNEAVGSWAADFVETMFIRLSRLILIVAPLALVAWFLWTQYGG